MGSASLVTRENNTQVVAGGALFCLLVVAVALAVAVSGCKASEAKSTGFTSAEKMTHNSELPFNKTWRKPDVDWKNYTKVYIVDVNTSYALQQSDWQKGERKDQIEDDVKKLGEYTKRAMITEFQKDPKRHFEVVSAPTSDPHAIQIEMALTEVVPSKVLLNALGYAPFFIGSAITATRFIAHDQSSVAFEVRVRDCATNEVVAMAADRETEQYAPVSVRGLTWYSNAEAIISQWASQFVQVLDRKPGEIVKGTEPFTLQPW